MEYRGSTASAREFAAAGRLEEWVHLYLRAEGGNIPLSDGIKTVPRCYFGLHDMPVNAFTRICGPEAGMKWPVEREGFERIVRELMLALQNQRDVPPIIAEYRRGEFELQDGNHRHEALRRLRIRRYPAIIWTTEECDRDDFVRKYL